ncbi:MAG: GNAT family N-acetyltransferase [Stomatobaculum sp.]
MIELGMGRRELLTPLCADSREVLVRAAMEGSMGRAFVPILDAPSFCLIRVGAFSYLLGLPPHGAVSIDLYNTLCRECADTNITPENTLWSGWLEKVFQGRFRTVSRYSLRVPEESFDAALLRRCAEALPEGFSVRRFDAGLFSEALREEWSAPFVASFQDALQYQQCGMGYAVLKGKQLVSGCSAYAFSRGMMEVEVATEKRFRRLGLATCAAAHFLSDCMERKLRPNWDAANLASVGLAEKLGYLFEREYQVYQISVEEEP